MLETFLASSPALGASRLSFQAWLGLLVRASQDLCPAQDGCAWGALCTTSSSSAPQGRLSHTKSQHKGGERLDQGRKAAAPSPNHAPTAVMRR